MKLRIVMAFGILGVFLSLGMGVYSVVSWQIVAVILTVSIGIPSFLLAYERAKSEGKEITKQPTPTIEEARTKPPLELESEKVYCCQIPPKSPTSI